METISPKSEDEVIEAVAWALAGEKVIELVSGGSKRGLGHPIEADAVLDLAGLAGITLYEPEELVLTAGPGTKMVEIEARLADSGQMLAFEPPDLGPLLGGAAGAATLGGVIASNLAGPRRFKAGAARDHVLGIRAISGRAELFKSGGRVVKNVTGYDLSKLVAGSFGTLAALTEVTIKVLPAPEKHRTVLVYGLDDAAAVEAMARALGGPFEVSGAAHLPAAIAARSGIGRVSESGKPVTALRVEGTEPSVLARCASVRALFEPGHEIDELHAHNGIALWREIGAAALIRGPSDRLVWRLSVPPADGARVISAIASGIEAEHVFDWGGGLIWLTASAETEDAGAAIIRDAVRATGGHAMLLRAPAEIRRGVPVFQPQAAGLAALEARVKEAFDPKRILNPGRMGAGQG